MRINTDKDTERIERFLDLYFVKLCFLGFFLGGERVRGEGEETLGIELDSGENQFA